MLEKMLVWNGVNDVAVGLGRLSVNLMGPAVGQFVYFAAAGGNAVSQVAIANPDVFDDEWGSRLGYLMASTGIELATEKLFGDVFFGKGLFNNASKSYTGLFAKRFIEEGVEESAAEVLQSILNYSMVDSSQEILPTMEEIGYAGLNWWDDWITWNWWGITKNATNGESFFRI